MLVHAPNFDIMNVVKSTRPNNLLTMETTKASAASTKRAFKDVNVEDIFPAVAAAKKKKTKTTDGAHDTQIIKSVMGKINDPSIKAALQNIIDNPSTTKSAVSNVAAATAMPKKSEAEISKLTKQTIKAIQQCMNEKLKWKNSYRALKGGDTKGGRIQVVCTDVEVFERIFDGATIKKCKTRTRCSMKTEEEANKCNLPFKGISYRYNSSYLCAPYSACLKDGTLTFSYKFSIG